MNKSWPWLVIDSEQVVKPSHVESLPSYEELARLHCRIVSDTGESEL